MYNKKFNVRNRNYLFVILGLAMHLIILWGILDINFHSPIIQDLPNVPILNNAPAKRLVLFIADGLRFRTFIEAPPKFLKQIMINKGAWGISHTRMPTESRPGVVAICAGLYEDPSAIFKGWKENPVDFDSVFNQSYFTWAWGSPDIIPMFTKGAKNNIHGDSYSPEWQDFDRMQGQIWRLDSWVFDKYINWLQEEAHRNKNAKRIILFLHLLGCDTTGHTSKPYSREYVDNMNYVDRKIEEVVHMTEDIFGDNSTAYVFTADHGMTDWGSHGSGSTDETETPLIVWGAGINAFNSSQNVEQVDITPLISSLIGAPIPINNEGVLPWQYLDTANQNYINRVLLNNLKQLTYQVKANRMLNCEDNEFADWREVELDNKILMLDKYLEVKDSNETLKDIVATIKLAKKALVYFRQYQRIRFLAYLSVMWFGWITLLFLKIAGTKRTVINSSNLLITDIVFVILLFTILIMHKVSGCNNWRLPCYALLAIISVWIAIRNAITRSIQLKIHNNKHHWLMGIEIVVLLATMFIGLMYRSFLSIGILCIGFSQKILLKDMKNSFFWTALCLAVFPLLPVVEPYPRVYIVLLSICVETIIVIVKVYSKSKKTAEILRLAIIGLIYLEFIDGRNWISWAILLTTPLYICTYPTQLKERMQGIMLSLFCPLVLLSASYEPFFFIILALHLSCWISDVKKDEKSEDLLTIEELLKAAIFMLYTLLCFFGTGNMASISSFDPSWTRHFVTVFSPFIMFSLILLKICIPLILVGCTSYTFGSSNSFLAVVLLGDCLTLPLIYCVTPQGSWLDIGSAISRFTITISLPCLLLLLYCLSYPLITYYPNKLKFHISLKKQHIV
uniref:GPI ethanolamine phosphate transferase 1 isoform X1 n=1 Tax=Osmia lignaria TaxID=473952 RepID=UPI001478AC8C|nr:GPI ethanolamine phosphate transferase 1 isoform X1 [Osmia lignaria]XP_034192609.1 GPI ethanolamine phosphate transferase 1 isoform X1 [Osmia lignaria]XP_034192610.1 GPI ethanolamine phosphate transferase 1 isoform X1 [Osmia lignaria]